MNKEITYLIADDDPMYREITAQQLDLIPNLKCLAICESAVHATEFLQTNMPDLLVLDVEMPGLTGIQLAKSLTKLPLIIFISSHTNYAADAFEVDAVDYLVKPATIERLMRAIDKVRSLLDMKNTIAANEGFKKENNDSFFIKDKNAFTRIHNNEVLYIESLGDFVNIFLENGQKKIALVSLKNIEHQLPHADFIRVARTHIVNKQKITAIDTNTVMLGKIQLTIGKTYADVVLQTVMGDSAIKRFI
jgi:two-component system, LytTR family, response regulator